MQLRHDCRFAFLFFVSFVSSVVNTPVDFNESMATQIKLPNLGENIESGDVLSILVSEGDIVKANQDLLEVETDKATMPIPSPQAGKITKILVSEGDTIEVGAPIMEIEAAEGAEKSTAKAGRSAKKGICQSCAEAERSRSQRRSKRKPRMRKWKPANSARRVGAAATGRRRG